MEHLAAQLLDVLKLARTFRADFPTRFGCGPATKPRVAGYVQVTPPQIEANQSHLLHRVLKFGRHEHGEPQPVGGLSDCRHCFRLLKGTSLGQVSVSCYSSGRTAVRFLHVSSVAQTRGRGQEVGVGQASTSGRSDAVLSYPGQRYA